MSKIKCPKCGSENIESERRINGNRRCVDCGYTWNMRDEEKVVDDAVASAYAQLVADSIKAVYNSRQVGLEPITYEQAAEIVLNIVFYNTSDNHVPQVRTRDSLQALINSVIGG